MTSPHLDTGRGTSLVDVVDSEAVNGSVEVLAGQLTTELAVEEIERRLENRFVLLTSGDRSAPERHRTLTAVIGWSWNLLSTSEQALLRRLSRFPDGGDRYLETIYSDPWVRSQFGEVAHLWKADA